MNSRFKWTVVGSSTCIALMLLIGARNGRAVSSDDSSVYTHIKVYTDVLQRINMEYVEEPNMKSVTQGAIDGLLESVDPFASYLTPDQYKQYEQSLKTQEAGVGLIVAKRYGYVAVVDVIPGSSADKQHISNGDLIESINGVATRDMPLAYAEELLNGAPGTTVDVSLLRISSPDSQRITLAREPIVLPQVTAKMLPGNVGYVHVTSVAASRVAETEARVQELAKQGARYMVVDLRHCSTGDQANGVKLANLFLKNGEIASVSGQHYEKQEFEAQPSQDIWNGPLVLITDRATAGGSEIAAAALLDDKRAQVVGERTYGDAAIRKTIPMGDDGAMIISVAKYYSPSGKAIQDTGVTPTVPVAEADTTPAVDEEGNPVPDIAPKQEGDVLLKQAVDLVTGKATVAELTHSTAPDFPGAPAAPPIITKAPHAPDASK